MTIRYTAPFAALAFIAVAGAASSPRANVRTVADSTMFVTADSGNSARYRVREQLVGLDLPNDAVGTTGGVTGMLVIGADGKPTPSSKFVVDVKPLKSDKDRRDNFVQNRLLETAKYPTVTIAINNLGSLKLPKSGPVNFQMRGDLTVRDVTKPTTWQVKANVNGSTVTGTAVTEFTFEEFNITKPRVPVVLSVADTIKLEYDFRLIRK